MRINVEVTGSIIQSIDAERRKIELATVRALNKTALWVRSQTVKQVSEEKQIPKKAKRKKLSVDKANRKRLWSVVKLSSQWIGVAKLGSIKQTKIGAKVGSRTYEGAFIATMKNGHIGIFKRRYMTPLPIDEIKVNTQAREIMKELVDNEVERVFEKYFDQQMSYMK
ncbi:MAG: phage tail protein [Wolbachia endosymbiont of Andrena nigroaenea]|uniref:phage tail protein n=1 Tax=Wolbachia endosymbiont (group A) of Andrena hattorfiana TaxID=2953977 RepID=UPI0021F86BF6|nr:phage tail protein [Wolbachia endosymbiont (group A) of Andrena hattorfiana]MDX5527175.1 phage tail protein [Wolbachia endosymbiont of Andrena nigroaenea]